MRKFLKLAITALVFIYLASFTAKASYAVCFWAKERSRDYCIQGVECWGRYDATEGQRCCEEGDTSPSTAGGTCICRSGAWKDAGDESLPCITEGGGPGGGNTIFNPVIRVQGVAALANYLGTLWQAAYIVVGILVLVYLLVGAIKYITAGGDEKAVTAAKTMMTNAIIGIVIVAASYPIIRIVEIVFGVNILQITWPTV